MTNRRFLSPLFALLFAGGAWAQEATGAWTLQQCIDYALEHNIQLQRTRIAQQESEVDVKTARAAWLPSLSFSTNHNVTNRPYSESRTNIVDDGSGNLTATSTDSETNYNGSYGFNASWTVFNGGKRVQTIKQQKLNAQMAELAIDEQANSLEEQIAGLYVQILYTAEAVEVCRDAVTVSEKQLERAKAMLVAGSIAKSDVAQLETQVADDRYQLVNMEATWREYKLQLKQLLELDNAAEMELQAAEVDEAQILSPLPDKTAVYEAALAARPEIRSSRMAVEAGDLDVKMARAGYLPTLNLTAGTGTSNTGGSDYSLTKQWKNNWNNSIGLSLSIPILNNRQTKSAVQKAKLQRQSTELTLLDEQKSLFSTVENLWLTAETARQRYVAATGKVASSEASFELVSRQFDQGLKNTVELLTEKSNLLSARQEQLQAKYTALLNRRLLHFYQGEPLGWQ